MNSALMRRFFKEMVDYPTEAEEIALLYKRFPKADQGHLARFVKLANMVRAAYRGTNAGKRMATTLSTAELIDWVEMSIAMAGVRMTDPTFDSERYALDRTAGMAMTPEDRNVLEELYRSVFTVQKKASP
jgi:MoxR-like ATPase